MDTSDLRVDLLDVIGGDTDLRRVGSTNSGEWAGPCPGCGGDDRFRVWPRAERPRYWCRRCGQAGDAIDYVRWRKNLSFAEACRALGADPDRDRLGPPRLSAPPPRKALPDPSGPSAAWKARAEGYVAEAEALLWSNHPRSAGARQWLRDRGLSDAALRRWRLGYQPNDGLYERPADWGLDGGSMIHTPRGLVLPWVEPDGTIWHIKTRRPPGRKPKYLPIRGGVPTLFGWQSLTDRQVAVLAEGEFDALLLLETCGDFIGAVTLGSASQPLTARAADHLLGVPLILGMLDNDHAGVTRTAKLVQQLGALRPVIVPSGKDPTDYWGQRGDLRALLTFELDRLGLPGPALDLTGDAEPEIVVERF